MYLCYADSFVDHSYAYRALRHSALQSRVRSFVFVANVLPGDAFRQRYCRAIANVLPGVKQVMRACRGALYSFLFFVFSSLLPG